MVGWMPCCCGACLIFTDNFNRVNADPVDGDWDEISGDWKIVDQQLFQDDASTAVVLCTADSPTEAQVTSVTLRGVADGDIYGLVMASNDAGTAYHLVELEITGTQSDTDFQPPGTAATGFSGDVAWTDPNNCKANDGSYATVVVDGDTESEYLIAHNFGFTIPSGVTVTGVEVRIHRKASAAGDVKDYGVWLHTVGGGLLLGSDHKKTAWWPTTETVEYYGSSSDLWDATLTPTVCNNSNFGVVVAAVGGTVDTDRTASVDFVEMRIHYYDPNDLLAALRLKYIDAILSDGDAEITNLPIYDASFLTLTGWIDADWFCGAVAHIGGDCTQVQAAPEALDGTRAGLLGSEDTYLDEYNLFDHYSNNPECSDCACVCTQDGTEYRMPFKLLLTITGTHACSTAAGEVELVFKGNDCGDLYVSDPTTATGCLVDFTFSLSCDWTCTGTTCTGGSLWVTDTANCGNATPTQLSGEGTCQPMAMVFCRGTGGGVGGCACCTGAAEPPPQYYFGDICFTVTEIP